MVNVGSVDGALRFVLGAVLIASPFISPLSSALVAMGAWKYALPVAGMLMLVTAIFRFCPAYTLLGIRTYKIK